MSSRLSTLDFSGELARLTKGFTGREWLFGRLTKLIDKKTEPLILLTAEPGVGKSALAAQLLSVRKDVAAYHFCFARRVATITPNTVIRSLANQLCVSVPQFDRALLESIKPLQVELNINIQIKDSPGATTTAVNINNVPLTNPDQELEILLRAPLASVKAPMSRRVIIIDALDEALSYKGTPNLVELLAKLRDLPPWLTLFCTSRRSDSVLSHLQPLEPFILDAEDGHNLADVRVYVEKRVSGQPVSERLQQAGTNSEVFIERITKLAAGNFLYAVVILDDISAGRLTADKFEDLPQGLDDVYAGFLRRIPDADWQSVYQSILGKLAVAQEPLTEDKLAAFTGIAPSKIRSALAILDQYLSFTETDSVRSFELFHESLRDFLLSKTRAGRYWCNPDEEHGAISNYYLADIPTNGIPNDPYAMRYLALHLSLSGKSDALVKQLSDYSWLKAKLENTSVYDLLADFRLAPRHPLIEDIESIIRLSTFALERDAGQLWSQFYSRSLERDSALLRNFPAAPEGSWLKLQRPSVRQAGYALKWVFHGHTKLVKHVCPVPNSSLLVSCSFDRTIRIWDLDSGREVRVITGHTEDVNSVAVLPDGSRIISGSDDLTVRFWDLHSGRETARIDNLPSTPEPVVISQDGKHIAAVVRRKPDYDDDLWIWEMESRKLVTKIRTEFLINYITFIPKSTWVAGRGGGSENGSVRGFVTVWDFTTGTEVRRLEHLGSDGFPNTAIAASPDGKYLASGGTEDNAKIKIFNLADGGFFTLPTQSAGAMRCVAFSNDGSRLLSAARPGQILPKDNVLDDSVELWDVKSRKCLARYPHDGFVQAITFSSDGAFGISATGNAKISVWQLGKALRETEKHSAHVIKAMVRHPAGRAGRAFTASIDGSLLVWNMENLKIEKILRSDIPLTAMDVDAAGSSLLTAGSEESWIEGDDFFVDEVLLRNIEQSDQSVKLSSHRSPGINRRYSTALLLPDLRRAILGGVEINDGGGSCPFVEMWDLKHRQRLVNIEEKDKRIGAAVPIENGKKLLAVSGHLCVWTIDELKAGPRVVAKNMFSALALSSDGKFAAVGGPDTFEVWDARALKRLAAFSGGNTAVHDICFVGNDLIASAGSDHSVRLWDWKTGAQKSSFYGDSVITTVAWAEAYHTVVACEESGRVHFLRYQKSNLHAVSSDL